MGAIRGRAASIVAADTDVTLTAAITGKEFLVKRLLLSNNGGVPCRVRLWDTFTEADGTVHSSSVNPVPMEDRNLLAGESVELVAENGLVTVSGAIVAQSSAAAAFPADVVAGAWGEFV